MQRSQKFQNSTVRSNDGNNSRSQSKRLNSASSRFRDTIGGTFSNCHRHCHESENKDDSISHKLAEYAPLRSNTN